jgi:tetratricopeptide (TPR) repeat protein
MVRTAERLGDAARVIHTEVGMANTLWFLGLHQRALPMLEHALSGAEHLRAPQLAAVAGIDLGQVCRSLGHYRRAIVVLDRVKTLLVGDLGQERLGRNVFPFVTTRAGLALALVEVGELDRAIQLTAEAASFAESIGHPASLVNAWSVMGHPLLALGRYEDAIPVLERGIAVARQPGLAAYLPMVIARLGCAYAGMARLDEALSLAADAAQQAVKNPSNASLVWAMAADVYVQARGSDQARAAAQRALELARQYAERGNQARALRLEAEASCLDPLADRDAIARTYLDASTLASELGMRPLIAHCHLGLGTLYQRAGERKQAREHFTAATTMFRDMGMHFWREKGEAQQKT